MEAPMTSQAWAMHHSPRQSERARTPSSSSRVKATLVSKRVTFMSASAPHLFRIVIEALFRDTVALPALIGDLVHLALGAVGRGEFEEPADHHVVARAEHRADAARLDLGPALEEGALAGHERIAALAWRVEIFLHARVFGIETLDRRIMRIALDERDESFELGFARHVVAPLRAQNRNRRKPSQTAATNQAVTR